MVVSGSTLRLISVIVANRSDAPIPQLAPKPKRPSSFALIARFAGVMPIIVFPAVSKLIVAQTGSPNSFTASRAASSSSMAYMVSNHKTSTPPSTSPSACALKASVASLELITPCGSMISPVGPIDPATTTRRSALSATSLAIIAAALFNSKTRFSSW